MALRLASERTDRRADAQRRRRIDAWRVEERVAAILGRTISSQKGRKGGEVRRYKRRSPPYSNSVRTTEVLRTPYLRTEK